MEGLVNIFGVDVEYDYLAGWIKYMRLLEGISQEALSHGICSTSHLSFFETGKKKLHPDLIEALLKKLGFDSLQGVSSVGEVRHKLYSLRLLVEQFNYDLAQELYEDIMNERKVLQSSPYSLEIAIHDFMFKVLVERRTYKSLQVDIERLDKIYGSLHEELKYVYMLASGKLIYDTYNHDLGIERLEKAYKLRNTAWSSYRLGVAYSNNDEKVKATYYLEEALNSYEKSGCYYNALTCHNFLGMCYTSLGFYDRAEKEFNTVRNGAKFFSKDSDLLGINNSLSHLFYQKKNYEESLEWSRKAMMSSQTKSNTKEHTPWTKAAWAMPDQAIAGACNYVKACIRLERFDDCNIVFEKFLVEENSESRYYLYLKFLYTSIKMPNEEFSYELIKNRILRYYENLGYLDICRELKLFLIGFLESKRKYKEATKLYKELIR